MTTAVIVHTVADRNRLRPWAQEHRLTPIVVGEAIGGTRYHGVIVMAGYDKFPPSPMIEPEMHEAISQLWIKRFLDRCLRRNAPMDVVMGYDALRQMVEGERA